MDTSIRDGNGQMDEAKMACQVGTYLEAGAIACSLRAGQIAIGKSLPQDLRSIEARRHGAVRQHRQWLRTRSAMAFGLVVLLLTGELAAAATQSTGGHLYRYKNAQGAVEIANAVPADRVAGGFEVLDAASGQVVERVAAQLSPVELVEKQARDLAAKACEQSVLRVQALYGSTEDIDEAAEQSQRTLETRIGHLDASRALEQKRLEAQELEAAQQERTGRVVTAQMQADMTRSRTQIGALETEIAQREQEQVVSRDQFAFDRRVFETGTCDVVPEARTAMQTD